MEVLNFNCKDMELEDILNSYCAFGMYWETCKRYYDEAGCDNCRYFINPKAGSAEQKTLKIFTDHD